MIIELTRFCSPASRVRAILDRGAVLPDDYDGYRAIAEAVPFTRIAGGEHEYNRWGFWRPRRVGA